MMNRNIKVTKGEIAKQQLFTAISIFLGQKNYPSVITLCGSSANILDQLVKRSKAETFLDFMNRVSHQQTGRLQKRAKIATVINTYLGFIAHRHYWPDEPEEIDLDLPELAYLSIVRVLADYSAVFKNKDPWIVLFIHWVRANKDGDLLLRQYAEAPNKLRRKK